MKKEKIPSKAMVFQDSGCVASCFSEGEENAPKMEMTVYSGGIIKNHWYWDDLAIDLNGMKTPGQKYPVLEDHDTALKIGFSGKPLVVDGKLKLNPENTVFVDTETSRQFRSLAKDGFPFQSSLRGRPTKIERIEEGSEAVVNGFTLKGPGSVWREWEYVEGSVCVFGWDGKTNASVFSKEEEEVSYDEVVVKKEVSKVMDITTLSKDHPELVKQIEDAAFAKAKAEFDKEQTKFSDTVTELNSKLSESSKKIVELEKRDAIRTEREMAFKSESIWTDKLAKSSIPERLFSKVRKGVSYSDFVKEGVFDEAAFGKSIDEEIKEWEAFNIPVQTVQGSGTAPKGFEDSKSKESDDLANDLFSLSGFKPAK